jgi:hypothetical protein
MNMPVKADRLARFTEMISPEREGDTLEEMFQRMTAPPDGVVGVQPEGLPAICAAWDVPYGRMLTWLMADANRYAVYERALAVAAHALVAETVGIADNESPATQRDRLRVDTRFRVAKHHAPDKYGERVQIENSTVVLLDAGLVGTAADLLDKIVRREKDITPLEDDEEI